MLMATPHFALFKEEPREVIHPIHQSLHRFASEVDGGHLQDWS